MEFSTRTMTAKDWNEITFFKPSEFNHPEKLGYEFVKWLDKLRRHAKVSITPGGDWRDEKRNIEVGGSKDSAHTDEICNALDIKVKPTPSDPNWSKARFAIIKTALDLGCRRIGMYSDGRLHLDMTHDKRAADVIWIAVTNPAK